MIDTVPLPDGPRDQVIQIPPELAAEFKKELAKDCGTYNFAQTSIILRR